jgi:hypothetical protein
MNHCVHVVHRVFRKPAVSAEPVRAMTLAAKTIVQAGGVHAFTAACATAASGMNLDGDAIAQLEFVDGRA